MNKIKHTSNIDSDIYRDSLAIRRAVFVTEQNVPEDLEIDNLESQCIYFNVYLDDQAVATARFYPTDDNGIHIQRVAVLKKYRQEHLGSDLLKYIFNYAQEENYNYVVLGAQDHAQNFYKKLGFKVIGKQYQEVGIAHHDMKLNL
ncbi:GNAT family N-acetyltransferase [Companilactobacillus kimchiensis]|nr:GNAT family N-acetyltransferase [Companilactobacillus kimchiensis]